MGEKIVMKCESCQKYDDCSTGSGLVWPCGAYVPAVVTYGDKIRRMSDDELATLLAFAHTNGAELVKEHFTGKPFSDEDRYEWIKTGEEMFLEAIKSPVEGGESDV